MKRLVENDIMTWWMAWNGILRTSWIRPKNPKVLCVSLALPLCPLLCQMTNRSIKKNGILYNHLNVHFNPAWLVRKSACYSKQRSSPVLVLLRCPAVATSQHLGQCYASLMASQFMAVKSASVRLTVKGPSTRWGSTCCSWEVVFMLLTRQELRGRMDFWKRWMQETYVSMNMSHTYLLVQF